MHTPHVSILDTACIAYRSSPVKKYAWVQESLYSQFEIIDEFSAHNFVCFVFLKRTTDGIRYVIRQSASPVYRRRRNQERWGGYVHIHL